MHSKNHSKVDRYICTFRNFKTSQKKELKYIKNTFATKMLRGKEKKCLTLKSFLRFF